MVALTLATHLFFFFVPVMSAVRLFDDANQRIDDPFGLYVYGEEISGLRVFAADGMAVMGDISKFHATSKADFNVTAQGALNWPGLWEVYTTSGSRTAFTKPGSPSVSTTWLALNNTGGPVKSVQFATGTEEPGLLTRIWWLYGYYVQFSGVPGDFYAHQLTEGLWQLVWSEFDLPHLEYPVITLRSVPPVQDS